MTKYESLNASIIPSLPVWKQALLTTWTVIGLTGLLAFVWVEPFSGWLFSIAAHYGASPRIIQSVAWPIMMAIRGVLMVEVFGYFYHRFFQHLGNLTRLAQVFRRNQMYHWVHHMVIYPIGRFYKKTVPYVDSEDGIAWSWILPAIMAFAVIFALYGFKLGSFAFMAAVTIYGKGFVETAHQRFHVADHPWKDSTYFHWLEKIHTLHHWDQRRNFTIIHPMMDWLFGTYLSPDDHQREIDISLADDELTVSDLINWGYLLIEASPAEYAAFISQARRHPRSIRKLDRLIDALLEQVKQHPEDHRANLLLDRAGALAKIVRPLPSPALAA